MSVIFEGIEMPTACCSRFEHCKFYNICEKRDTIRINCKPSDCPVKALEQEPKTGHWISRPHIYGVAFCSECGFELKINNTNYCPNCGADMREVKE